MIRFPHTDRMAMLDTPAAHVPTLSLADQARDPDGFAAAFGRSFERFGFAIVADHGIGQRLIDRAWAPTEAPRSEEHTSELQSLMRISYAVFCLKKKNNSDTYKITIMHIYT